MDLPRLTDRLPLGETGLMVSPFCLGAIPGPPETVEAAFDAGINFFFLSGDLHWGIYESTRLGLARLLARRPSVRDEIVVAGTSYVAHPGFVLGALTEIVMGVPGLGRLDVAVVGGAHENDLLPRLHFAEGLRARGGVRSVAASLHDRRSAITVHNHRLADLAFIRYNPIHPGARGDLFPALDDAAPTLLYNFKSMQGWLDPRQMAQLGLSPAHWHPTAGDYYRFALSQPQVDGILCALGTPRQIEELAVSLEAGPLDDEEQAYLIGLGALATGTARLERPVSAVDELEEPFTSGPETAVECSRA